MIAVSLKYPTSEPELQDCLPELQNLLNEIRQVRKNQARVYSTFISSDEDGRGGDYTFITTSKDTHLELGKLGRTGLRCLAVVLHKRFAQDPGESSFLVRIDLDRSEANAGHPLLIVKTDDGDGPIFTLTPA